MTIPFVRRSKRRSRGQSLVEFALILPIFLLVLMGILDLGRAVYYSSTLSNAAREAARQGIVDQTCSHVVDQALQRSVGMDNVAVEVVWLDGSNTQTRTCQPVETGTAKFGNRVLVTVDYDYNAATPIIGNLVGTIHMRGQSTFTVEAECVEGPPPTCPAGS
ncbi:MAG TPA: TadE family protein [Candidatus Limnocylindria bacterium]